MSKTAKRRRCHRTQHRGFEPDDPACAVPLSGQTWIYLLPARVEDGQLAIRRGPDEIEEVVVDADRASELVSDQHARDCRVIDTPAWPIALQNG